jgi:hypothetical protein
MIELNSDILRISIPEVHESATLGVNFQRTLRIPDDGREYPLPPGLGSFPLRHIDDYAERAPSSWLKRGGVLLPMWQSEALWLHFRCKHVPDRGTEYPFAMKIATGKINAVTGKQWERGLSRNPQNYLVLPSQPWLDGYCVEKGVIQQFVAMPLGRGYSAEEQITGEAEFGGIQIEAFPMKREVFEERFPVVKCYVGTAGTHDVMYNRLVGGAGKCQDSMGLAPGGRMRQEIFQDPYSIHDWDLEHGSRCFIHLVNSVAWQQITGQKPPSKPPTIREYSEVGYPWFDYYDPKAEEVEGSKILAQLKSVKQMGEEKRESPLPDNKRTSIWKIFKLGPKPSRSQVRETQFD